MSRDAGEGEGACTGRGDASFVDTWLPPQVGRNTRLDQLHDVLDWTRLAEIVRDL